MSFHQRVYLLVDGHSVIYAWPELRALHHERPARGRDELIRALQNLHDTTHWRVTIVFDGKQGKSPPRPKGDMVVSYSRRNETADAVIERLCHISGQAARIVVVTADQAERNAVEAAGAICFTPDWLRSELHDSQADFERSLQRIRRQAAW